MFGRKVLFFILFHFLYLVQLRAANSTFTPPASAIRNLNFNIPNVYSPLSLIKNKQYFIIDEFKGTFFQAAQFCAYIGMQLATIESAEEELQIENQLTAHGYAKDNACNFWLSGTDLDKPRFFVWLSTGRPFIFTNWAINEPNDAGGKERCVVMRYFKNFYWNDLECEFQYNFVCQKQI